MGRRAPHLEGVGPWHAPCCCLLSIPPEGTAMAEGSIGYWQGWIKGVRGRALGWGVWGKG